MLKANNTFLRQCVGSDVTALPVMCY